jgi:radical SAM superfamily enzyme YgiQ (UPF0313 family)
MDDTTKVYLVNTPINRYESFSVSFNYRPPHLGLGMIASFLRSKNYHVKVFDLNYFSYTKFLEEIQIDHPFAVGITSPTEYLTSVKIIVNAIKKISKKIITILGGPHVSAIPERTLTEIRNLDFGIIGEGEYTIYELLEHIRNNSDYSRTNGICYRKDMRVLVNPARPFIENLDLLPFPAWDLFDLNKYSSFGIKGSFQSPELPILTQRGCPYQCVFCQKVLGSIVRSRSLENILKEIKYNYFQLKINRFAIIDETFTFNKEKIINFCKHLIKTKLNRVISWWCTTRINLLDEEIIKYMKCAGCRLVSFGLESGDTKILEKINKGITLEQTTKNILILRKYNIEIHYGIIYGLPFETILSLHATLKFVLSNRPDLISFSILIPYPGTKVYNYCFSNYGGLNLIAKKWSDYSKQMGNAIELNQIPRRYLHLFHLYSYFRFFFHPRNIRYLFRLVEFSSVPVYLIEKLKSIFQ